MVDVQASNAKLIRRKKEMLVHLTGESDDAVQKALSRAAGRLKIAFLLLHGCDLQAAETLLDRCGGRLREAVRVAKAS